MQHEKTTGARESDGSGAPVNDILSAAVSIAGGMVECGADIHRAEDTAARICAAHGYAQAEIFCVISFLSVTVILRDGTPVTRCRRMQPDEPDLYRLEQLNELSREVCDGRIAPSQVPVRIERLKSTSPYAPVLLYGAAMLASASYAVYFGGGWTDALASAVVGLASTLFLRFAPARQNELMTTVLRAFLTGVLSALIVRAGLGRDSASVFIGALMLMTPGLTLATALHDLLGGDTMSGMTRMLTAILTALATAGGIALAIALTGGTL